MLIGCPLKHSFSRFRLYCHHLCLHFRHAFWVYLRKVALNLGFCRVITFQIDDHPDRLSVVHPSLFGASVALSPETRGHPEPEPIPPPRGPAAP